MDLTVDSPSPEGNDKVSLKKSMKNFTFYDLDADDSMKNRIALLKKLHPKFVSLKED